MNLEDGIHAQVKEFGKAGYSYNFIEESVSIRSQLFKFYCKDHKRECTTTYIRFVEKEDLCWDCGLEKRRATRTVNTYQTFCKQVPNHFPGWSVHTPFSGYQNDKQKIQLLCPENHVQIRSVNRVRRNIRLGSSLECQECYEQSIIDLCRKWNFTHCGRSGHRLYGNIKMAVHRVKCKLCKKNYKLVRPEIERGCAYCGTRVNFNEEYTRQVFEHVFEQSFPHTHSYPRLVNRRGNNLTLDGFCKKLMVAFEYNHSQHWDKSDRMYSEELIKNDQDKAQKCKSLGIKLIIIEPRRKPSKLEEFVYSVIQDHSRRVKLPIRKNLRHFIFNHSRLPSQMQREWSAVIEAVEGNGAMFENRSFRSKTADYTVKCKNNHIFIFRWYDHFKNNRKYFCRQCGTLGDSIETFRQMVKNNGFAFANDNIPVIRNYTPTKKYTLLCPHRTAFEGSRSSFYAMLERDSLPVNECFECEYSAYRNADKLTTSLNKTLKIIEKKGKAILKGKLHSHRESGVRWKCLDCAQEFGNSLRNVERRVGSSKRACTCC